MTATLDDVTKKSKREPAAEERAVEEMVARAREQGLSLTGPDGLLKQLTKTVLETALNQEMTEHLGHDKHGPPGNETGNVRNGIRSKTVLTESSGHVEIDVHRDRDGSFEPKIVRKRQRRLSVWLRSCCRSTPRALSLGDLGPLRRGLRLGLEGDGEPDHLTRRDLDAVQPQPCRVDAEVVIRGVAGAEAEVLARS